MINLFEFFKSQKSLIVFYALIILTSLTLSFQILLTTNSRIATEIVEKIDPRLLHHTLSTVLLGLLFSIGLFLGFRIASMIFMKETATYTKVNMDGKELDQTNLKMYIVEKGKAALANETARNRAIWLPFVCAAMMGDGVSMSRRLFPPLCNVLSIVFVMALSAFFLSGVINVGRTFFSASNPIALSLQTIFIINIGLGVAALLSIAICTLRNYWVAKRSIASNNPNNKSCELWFLYPAIFLLPTFKDVETANKNMVDIGNISRFLEQAKDPNTPPSDVVIKVKILILDNLSQHSNEFSESNIIDFFHQLSDKLSKHHGVPEDSDLLREINDIIKKIANSDSDNKLKDFQNDLNILAFRIFKEGYLDLENTRNKFYKSYVTKENLELDDENSNSKIFHLLACGLIKCREPLDLPMTYIRN